MSRTEVMQPACKTVFRVRDYDLAATLTSGQAFRWRLVDGAWESVVERRWVRLTPAADGIAAEIAAPADDWRWLSDHLQTDVDLNAVVKTFPADDAMQAARDACRGLRLLRQDPWECLASFILSSTKQIVQIQQIVETLCNCFGERVATPDSRPPAHAFPSAQRLASASEAELRSCKMGFRAPYLKATAERVASGQIDLERLRNLRVGDARAALVELPGVGRKIADCVLLFAYGLQEAFPVDVWVMKALRELYFPKRRVSPARLFKFTETYFGPSSGYAQQYLFHYMRTRPRLKERASVASRRAKRPRRRTSSKSSPTPNVNSEARSPKLAP